MARQKATLEDLRAEVERLEKSEYVALGKSSEEQKLRKRIYNLRYYESIGKRVSAEGKNRKPN